MDQVFRLFAKRSPSKTVADMPLSLKIHSLQGACIFSFGVLPTV
jgi:hypothetical protein